MAPALLLLVASTPWYQSGACMDAASLVYQARIEEARALSKKMAASSDLDVKACGLWMAIGVDEMEIAFVDDDEALWQKMGEHLDALEAFGKEHIGVQRFEDLVLETSFRRVRLLTEQDEKTRAVLAARDAFDLLKARRRVRKGSPTYFYAEAIINLAITHADWHVRAVLTLVGIEGDGERGKKAMGILLSRPSVYRDEVTVVARSFTRQKPGLFEDPIVYSARLHQSHPTNPQLAYFYAHDLRQAGRCAEVGPALAAVKTNLSSYSTTMQAKLATVLSPCR